MEEILTTINTYLVPHWPFLAAIIVFMTVGQVLMNNVFTKTAHRISKPVWFWWWGRKTLPLQPILLGIILGVFWKNPEVGVDTLPERTAYFAMAGALSVWAYEFLKGLAKKEGIDLTLPGADETIPPKTDQQPPVA